MAIFTEPLTIHLSADDHVPNHPRWPLLVYRNVVEDTGSAETILQSNRWVGAWRNGIYPYPHYHTTAHEVLVVSHGRARVQFGGSQGKTLDIEVGDVAVLPAGTGHCRLSSSPDFEVVGAYPRGQTNWDLKRSAPTEADRAALETCPKPEADPIYGATGPLMRLWH